LYIHLELQIYLNNLCPASSQECINGRLSGPV
jgi:hypothetical protein